MRADRYPHWSKHLRTRLVRTEGGRPGNSNTFTLTGACRRPAVPGEIVTLANACVFRRKIHFQVSTQIL